ncbi:unannotated protein [freshwater metagenome]|uniref:Unannotated protein n=1 Tax=freshwater metagenome TaxID=449393 RepID=A0A6J7ARA2_9ZZZZ
MKMRAGLKLCGKNPKQIPTARIATSGPMFGWVSMPIDGSARCWLYRKNAAAAIATMPAASPSRPSIRLIAFVIPNSHSTVINGTQSAVRKKTSMNGRRK